MCRTAKAARLQVKVVDVVRCWQYSLCVLGLREDRGAAASPLFAFSPSRLPITTQVRVNNFCDDDRHDAYVYAKRSESSMIVCQSRPSGAILTSDALRSIEHACSAGRTEDDMSPNKHVADEADCITEARDVGCDALTTLQAGAPSFAGTATDADGCVRVSSVLMSSMGLSPNHFAIAQSLCGPPETLMHAIRAAAFLGEGQETLDWLGEVVVDRIDQLGPSCVVSAEFVGAFGDLSDHVRSVLARPRVLAFSRFLVVFRLDGSR